VEKEKVKVPAKVVNEVKDINMLHPQIKLDNCV
jgi:hypothetical protein